MARLPIRLLTLTNGERPIAEARLLTPMVRLWRFCRWLIVFALIAVAYAAGVMSGTSGHFADGMTELRRWTQTAPGNDGRLAAALTALERLDASEGIEPVKTRHGVAATLDELTTSCRAEIARIEEQTARTVAFALNGVERAIADVQVTMTRDIAELQETSDATGVLAANASLDCGRTHVLLDGILSASPADSATDPDVANIEE